MRLHEHLDDVKDKESFATFVSALIEDCEQAQKLQKENPDYWRWGAPNGWQNGTIESFLDAALAGSQSPANEERIEKLARENPWKCFANFLYLGKIYE